MKNWGHIVNCGHYNKLWDYEISNGALGGRKWGLLIKAKSYKLEGNKSLVKG